jgi:hypothetical protein
MNPEIEPPSVSRHAMVYDEEKDRIILFGGWLDPNVPFDFTDEFWAYDYESNTWTDLTP